MLAVANKDASLIITGNGDVVEPEDGLIAMGSGGAFAQAAARASIAVAEAKVLSTELSLLASEKLFELSGSRATLAEFNLDRHWRNARVHTLHDPVRWKYHAIGAYRLNGTLPARHSWI